MRDLDARLLFIFFCPHPSPSLFLAFKIFVLKNKEGGCEQSKDSSDVTVCCGLPLE